MHLTEDDLILHYYGEAQGAETGITEHLDGCAECGAGNKRVVERAGAPPPRPAAERRPPSANDSTPCRARWFSSPGQTSTRQKPG